MLEESVKRRFIYFLENKPLIDAWEVLEDSFISEDKKKELAFKFLDFYLKYELFFVSESNFITESRYEIEPSSIGLTDPLEKFQGMLYSVEIDGNISITGWLAGNSCLWTIEQFNCFYRDDYHNISAELILQKGEEKSFLYLKEAVSILMQKNSKVFFL